ncbi:unnamed protein product, partial [Mesorhabditis belari]|uniref:Uncharacterized protein n=1 Tax=Mesorhabditis belari TaxID=2138241 RepID=A0AAF3EGL0_9BILA
MRVTTLLILLLLHHAAWTLRLDKCNAIPLGMESGAITDAQITASSSFDQQSVGPQNASIISMPFPGRIRSEFASGAWCPKSQIHPKSYEFIQVNLNKTHVITAVETQGRYGNGTGREYATHFMIDYLREGAQWIRYRNRSGHELLDGNKDTMTALFTKLDPPIVASRIRLVPSSKQTRTMCMRIELHGCLNTDGLMFYSLHPEGSRVGFFDFRDRNFEQVEQFAEDGIKRGLGTLSDGNASQRSPYEDTPENSTWIGWNREKTDGNVSITFEFDYVRNFSSMDFNAFGERMEQIDVIFSQDGINFPLASQISSLDQSANRSMRLFNLKLPLHRRPGKVLKISFRFATEWFFLSEINFNSILYNHADEVGEKEIVLIEPEKGGVDYSILYYAGLALMAVLCTTCILCCLLCLRRRRPREKEALDIYEGETRAAMIVTTMGSNRTYPTHSYINQLNSMFSGEKTVSTSLSSKSNSSTRSAKTEAPSWQDFHFPPPPKTPVVHEAEGPYAEPSLTLPLLPSQHRPPAPPRMGANTLNKNPKKHKMYVDDSLHYATSNIFTTYGFDNVKKVHNHELEIGADLGEGKFTLVRECRGPGIPRAAHKCAKERGNIHARRTLLDELRVLSTLNHPRVVRLLAMDEDAGMILELAEHGDIRTLLKSNRRLGLDNLLTMCVDVALGMEYLETQGVIHGHLTPGNVLVDCNLRAKVSSPRGQTHHAQLRYSAPESIIMNEWSNKSDMWAYGVTTWEIVQFGEHLPFEGFSNAEIMENAEKMLAGDENTMYLVLPETVPRVFHEALSKVFRADPNLRPSFADITAKIANFYES